MKEVRQGNLNTHCAKERGNSNAKQSAEKKQKNYFRNKEKSGGLICCIDSLIRQ